MRLSTPWSPDSDAWTVVLESASFPGMDGKCSPASHALSPAVHRFDHVALLPEDALPLPSLEDWRVAEPADGAESSASGLFTGLGLVGLTVVDAIENLFENSRNAGGVGHLVHQGTSATRRPWELSGPLWGVQIVVEQAWFALGATAGEAVGTIPLGPGEERKVEVFSWQRKKSTLDLESSEVVDRQTSTQVTTHDSFQVARRVQKEFHWEAKGEMSFSPGNAISGGAGGSTVSAIERQVQHTKDVTRKVSEQVRTERKMRVSTTEEIGTERRETQIVRNPNACHSVTYHYYEHLNHYRVKHAVAELNYVIVAPNELLEITCDWVGCHEGLLRAALLDATLAGGFDAARRLAQPTARSLIAEAAMALEVEFRPFVPPEPEEDDGGGWSFPNPLDIVSAIGSSALEATSGALDLLTGGGGGSEGEDKPADPTLILGNPPTTDAVRGFLHGLVKAPTVSGVVWALILLRRYYGNAAMPSRLAQAFGRAASLLAAHGATTRPDLTASETLAAGAVAEQERAREEELERQRAEVEFERLRCHLEENLLYYMRAIWVAEDPAQRYARFASRTIAGTAFWNLAENRPLGFHLNGTVFPVRLGAELEAQLVEWMASSDDAPPPWTTPSGLTDVVVALPPVITRARAELAEAVKHLSAPRLAKGLKTLVRRSLGRAQILVAADRITKPAGKKVSGLDRMTDVLRLAHEDLAKFDRTAVLAPAEEAVRSHVDRVLDRASRVGINQPAVTAHIQAVALTGRWAVGLPATEDVLVSLPSTGMIVEAIVSPCSACSPITTREIEARVGRAEAERRSADAEATRREKKLEVGDLSPNPPASALAVNVDIEGKDETP